MDTQRSSSASAICLNFIYQSLSLWFEYLGPLPVLNECGLRVSQNQNSIRGGQGSDRRDNCGNTTIAKYASEGKMKDGPISKLLITKIGHRSTQFKNIPDTLPVLCADKNFQGLDEVRHRSNWNQLHANLSRRHTMVEHSPRGNSNRCLNCRYRFSYWRTHFYHCCGTQKNASLTQISRNSYCWNTNGCPRSSLKSTPSSLLTKKALITIIFGQCDETTKTKLL